MQEEHLDIFDVNGNFLGVKTRSFCHRKSTKVFHKVVWVWIINSNKQILVQKRSLKKKEFPGKWDMPVAGHKITGETCLKACVREAQEELGLITKESDFKFLKEYVNKKGLELAQVYILKNDTKIENMVLQKGEVDEVKWLYYDEFVKYLYSDEFCNQDIEYKDWVCKILK